MNLEINIIMTFPVKGRVYDKMHEIVNLEEQTPQNVTNQEIKSEILKTVSEELDVWLEKKDGIKDAYDYETEFGEMAFRLNQIMFQKSIGEVRRSRNGKKNFKLVLGGLK